MPTWAYLIVGVAVGVGPTLTAVALLRKAPAETQKINVETVDLNVTYASRVRDLAVADWERVGRELDHLRKEFDQYKRDTDDRLAEQATEVRAARAGEAEAIRKADRYAAENAQLRERVEVLEAEVDRLKGRKS